MQILTEQCQTLSSSENRRLRGDFIALCSFLMRGRAEGGAEVFSLGSSYRMRRNDSQLYQGRLKLNISKHFSTKRWPNMATCFLGRWSMPQACQCFRGIWTMPLITCFKFWSTPKWSGHWTR